MRKKNLKSRKLNDSEFSISIFISASKLTIRKRKQLKLLKKTPTIQIRTKSFAPIMMIQLSIQIMKFKVVPMKRG